MDSAGRSGRMFPELSRSREEAERSVVEECSAPLLIGTCSRRASRSHAVHLATATTAFLVGGLCLFLLQQHLDMLHLQPMGQPHGLTSKHQRKLVRERQEGHTAAKAGTSPSACELRHIHCGQSERMEATRARLRDFNVTCLVFYGRRSTSRILHAYLQRNLAVNGGVLQQVIFLVRTNKTEDLQLLDLMLRDQPLQYKYKVISQPIAHATFDYSRMYEGLEDSQLYLKIDDDIVYIKDGAVEAMLEEYLERRFLFVSANVINHPWLSHIHHRMGATLPFHPPNQTLPEDSHLKSRPSDWVLQHKENGLEDTAIGSSSLDPFSPCTWLDWRCAAVTHYSFLHHLEHHSLEAYNFQLWDFSMDNYFRWSINCIVFNTSDLLHPMPNDDEMAVTQTIPKARNYHTGAVGSALMAHFSYRAQIELYNNTNLLSHYERAAVKVTGHPLLPAS